MLLLSQDIGVGVGSSRAQLQHSYCTGSRGGTAPRSVVPCTPPAKMHSTVCSRHNVCRRTPDRTELPTECARLLSTWHHWTAGAGGGGGGAVHRGGWSPRSGTPQALRPRPRRRRGLPSQAGRRSRRQATLRGSHCRRRPRLAGRRSQDMLNRLTKGSTRCQNWECGNRMCLPLQSRKAQSTRHLNMIHVVACSALVRSGWHQPRLTSPRKLVNASISAPCKISRCKRGGGTRGAPGAAKPGVSGLAEMEAASGGGSPP